MIIGFILATISIFICGILHDEGDTHYQITSHPYQTTRQDKGRHLEYLTYRSLRHFENKGGRFLFNVNVPKKNGDTTEIDVLLICTKGLFVFECKNFSGWIFGDELQKNWTQTLPTGRGLCRKEQFYNPIMQNSAHIKHLKNFIGKNIPTWSVIVFSDKTVFKNITIRSKVNVVNHNRVVSVVKAICSHAQDIYTEAEINDIHSKIYPYSQVA